MATRDDRLLNQSRDSRRSFLDNTNRRKANDGNPQRLGGVSSYGRSTEPRTLPRRPPSATFCHGESSQFNNPALGTTLSNTSRDLTEPTVHIQVKNRTGFTQQPQSDKIKMNKDSTQSVKKSVTNATSVSRTCEKKESATLPPKNATSLIKPRLTSTTMEAKQLTAQPDQVGSGNKIGISRTRTSINCMKNKVTTQSPVKPRTVEGDRNNGILASKHVMQNKETAQPPKGSASAGLVKNGGTSRIIASTEKTKHPRTPVGLVKDIGTSIISASMQKEKAIHLPKDSPPSVKKIETTPRIPRWKSSVPKKGNNQPSKGSAGVVNKSRTRTLLSKPVTHKKETTSGNLRQMRDIYKDHIVWEGFVNCIVLLEKSCLLCDGDLAINPENRPDIENLNPAENAVLSCGHVFHSSCLRLTMADEDRRDPPCIICASILC